MNPYENIDWVLNDSQHDGKINNMSKKDEFIKELHDLLEKYNAEISIGLDGDTHGLDSWLDVEFRDGDSFRYEKILKVDELTKFSLKKHLPK